MNNLSFESGVDVYLSVLVVALNAVLAVVSVSAFLAILGIV